MSSTYSVVLRSDLPPAERELLEGFAHIIRTTQGAALLELRCSKIDVSHHSYIEMEVEAPPHSEAHPLRIPHHFVLLIHGDEQRPSIGFAATHGAKAP